MSVFSLKDHTSENITKLWRVEAAVHPWEDLQLWLHLGLGMAMNLCEGPQANKQKNAPLCSLLFSYAIKQVPAGKNTKQ